MEADDVPTHHTVGDFVDLARRVAEEDSDLLAFGHDMLNAYRQWPVRRPEHCATFLPTAAGVTLWMHMAMCFGAAASVWNFNRAGDAVQLVVRALVFLLGGHYVDDFRPTPPSTPSAACSATSACRLSRVKPSRRLGTK